MVSSLLWGTVSYPSIQRWFYYEGDSIFLDQYQFSAKILDFINCFCFWHTVKLTSFKSFAIWSYRLADIWTIHCFDLAMGGGGHWRKEKEVVRITLLQVRVRVLFFFFNLGDRMKIDFLIKQLFFLHVQCNVHGPCGLQFFIWNSKV